MTRSRVGKGPTMSKLKLLTSKESRATVSGYTLTFRPATVRTSYAIGAGHSGGTPVASAQRTADDAWLIVTRSGTVGAVVQKWSDGEWSVSKIRESRGADHILSAFLISGETAQAAIEAWLR